LRPNLSIEIRVEGDRDLLERMRKVLLPDFSSTISSELMEYEGEKAVWKVDLTAEKISRLRAITNSILKAMNLFLEVEESLERDQDPI
jgi:tRNA threonylcarbamoyladenosine modification (KEOPS) complex  Pcc1 subunit